MNKETVIIFISIIVILVLGFMLTVVVTHGWEADRDNGERKDGKG